MDLREAKFPQDMDSLRTIMTEYLHEFDTSADPREYWDDQYYAACASGVTAGTVLVLLQEDAGVLTGFCIARSEPYWCRPSVGIGHIEELYVAPTHRRRGRGRLMVNYVKLKLARNGVATIDASVVLGNAGALGFWESLGFENSTFHLIASARVL